MKPKNRTSRTLLMAIAFVVFSWSSVAQSAVGQSDSSATSEAEIKSLVLKMADLVVKADWDAYAQRLSPEYLRTDYEGRVENKDETLAALRDPARKIIIMEAEPDQRVHIYGDTAIGNAEFTLSVREAGHVKTHRVRITDTLLRRDGQWIFVAEQLTPIGK